MSSISERLKNQKFHFETSTGQGTYGYTVNVSNIYPSNELSVDDFTTPQGPFIENIPLPEEVVRDITAAMDSIRGQNTSTINLDKATLSFISTEGSIPPAVQEFTLKNIGDFGSLLNATITSNQPWVAAVPDIAGNIAKDESTVINAQVSTAGLTHATYVAALQIADRYASNSPQTISVSLTILPTPAIKVLPLGAVNFIAPYLGTAPLPQYFEVSNVGPLTSKLNWSILKCNNSKWLSFTPPSGGPMNVGDSPVLVNVFASITNLLPGEYIDVLRITNGDNVNDYVELEVNLKVVSS